jgi:hypothetical protein
VAERPRSQIKIGWAAGLIAAVPAVVSVIHALAVQWVPIGDRAVIAARSYDVFSSHTPLVGQYSASSRAIGQTTHSLGPMLFWLLALPSRFLGDFGTPLTMGIVSVACIVGCVMLAGRRGGLPLMLGTAVALALMGRALPAELFHDSWNPSAGVLPLTLFMFLAWSLACGEYRLLPLIVLVASFVAQCHLTFVPPALGALIVGLAGLGTTRPTRVTRWLVGAAVVALICWSGPIIDEVIHRPGNIVAIARSLGHAGPRAGLGTGWHVLVRALGIPPWWLRARSSVGDQLSDAFRSPGVLSDLSCVVFLIALAALVVLGIRRREPTSAAGAALALVLCAALTAAPASTPTRNLLGLTLGYTLWWGAPAGMFAWLVLAWGYARLLAGLIGRPVIRPGAQAPVVALALLATGLAAALTAVAEGQDLNQGQYRPARSLISQVLAHVPKITSVALERDSGTYAAYNYEAGLLYALRRDGKRVVSADLAVLLSSWYAAPAHLPLALGVVGGAARGGVVIASAADASGSPVRVVLIKRG